VAKYDPLFEWLCRAGDGPVELTFDEIDRLVGGLPRAARDHQAWWSNEQGGRHVQATAWTNAGRQVVHVDRAAGKVRFSAPGWLRGA
jgi:hypothetical protein